MTLDKCSAFIDVRRTSSGRRNGVQVGNKLAVYSKAYLEDGRIVKPDKGGIFPAEEEVVTLGAFLVDQTVPDLVESEKVVLSHGFCPCPKFSLCEAGTVGKGVDDGGQLEDSVAFWIDRVPCASAVLEDRYDYICVGRIDHGFKVDEVEGEVWRFHELADSLHGQLIVELNQHGSRQ